MKNRSLLTLTNAGVSVWLDDFSRDLIDSGQLSEYINTYSVKGVTTNPSIFQKAISQTNSYQQDIQTLTQKGLDVDEVLRKLTTDDVRRGCDLLADLYTSSGGIDGRISLEVDPRLAHKTQETIQQAKELWNVVDRPNAMIKIPATDEGLPAITAALAEGISVNVTLIFSPQRYEQVIQAYAEGIRQARDNNKNIDAIHSVASIFVSRLDSAVDTLLEGIGTDEALNYRGRAGLANARIIYRIFENYFLTPASQISKTEVPAQWQRPLWASTGVKNPQYPQDLYVSQLVAPYTVNTMPTKTLQAVAQGSLPDITSILTTYDNAIVTMHDLEKLGINFSEVFATLEREGVQKFSDSWNSLRDSILTRQ